MEPLLAAKKKLDVQELSMLSIEYQRRKKSPFATWLLWLFFGSIGGHRYYLGDFRQAILQTVLFTFAFILGISFASSAETEVEVLFYAPMAFLLFLSVPFILALLDAFFIGRRLAKKNSEIEMNIINQIKEMRS